MAYTFKGQVFCSKSHKLYMCISSIKHVKLNSSNFQHIGVKRYPFPLYPKYGLPLCPKVNFLAKLL